MMRLAISNINTSTVCVFVVDLHGNAVTGPDPIEPGAATVLEMPAGCHLELRAMPQPVEEPAPAADQPLSDEDWRQWVKPFAVCDESGVQVSRGFLSQAAAVLAFATGTRSGWTVRDAAGTVVHLW